LFRGLWHGEQSSDNDRKKKELSCWTSRKCEQNNHAARGGT
jgi:hypothetical protein